MRRLFSSKRGFTMIELVIVITILAVLSAIGISSYGGDIARSKANADLYNARLIATAISRAYVDGQLKKADGTIDDSLFSDTNILELTSSTGIGAILSNLNYIPQPTVFKVKGKEKQNWEFGYTLTKKGFLNVYVCEDTWVGAPRYFNLTAASKYVQLYPNVSATTIDPYTMVINK